MAKKTDSIEARVLSDVYLLGMLVPCNSVVIVSKKLLQDYADALDASPEAVAFAKSEGAKPHAIDEED